VQPEVVRFGDRKREGVVVAVALAHQDLETVTDDRPERLALARQRGLRPVIECRLILNLMDDFDLPPEEVRRLGRLAADAVAEHRARLLERPVFGKVGPLASLFDEPLPVEGLPADDVLTLVRERILTHPFGNSHPRFFAFINATADPLGTVADYLAAALNPNCWGGDHAAVHVEAQVMRWIAEILGLPKTAEGILASGGSMANFIALAAARRATTPGNVREEGTGAEGRLRIVVYASDQVHNCVDKSVDLLGIGLRHLRKIPCDDRFLIRMDLLRQAVATDRRAGLLPAIVVGNAGTVNTGSIDPLEEIADFCKRESLWFHADGAYGGLAMVSPTLRPLFAGLERAHSVAADPHKWMYVPYEAGAALVREPGRLAEAFRRPAEYLLQDAESPVNGPVSFNDRGPELSRGFRALKVWMGLKRHGTSGYAAAVQRDIALARTFSEEIKRREDFELLAEPTLSIANFRYRPRNAPPRSDEALDTLNRRIVNRLVGSGAFFLAPTILKGRTSMRVAIVNFRTRDEDLTFLLDEAARIGRELAESAGGA
jgi:glutamate/tyrosine decarboxylase-like PLP-dependent enzyme